MQREQKSNEECPIKVLLADDHKMVAEAFATLLKKSFDVVGTTQDGRALVEEAIRLKPDVIVTDIFLPLLNGIDAARQLRDRGGKSKLVFLTMHADPGLAAEVFRGGATGYVSKDSGVEELIHAIQEAAHGRAYVTPLIAKEMIGVLLKANHGRSGLEPQLTPRQREVLQLIGEGHSMKEIADILNISTRTAETHKYETMEALNVQTTAELIHWSIRLRLISIE
jgi:DNA-binding NarL/FixJ family response regulator